MVGFSLVVEVSVIPLPYPGGALAVTPRPIGLWGANSELIESGTSSERWSMVLI